MRAMFAMATSRLGLGLAAVVFLAASIWGGWSYGLANRDRLQSGKVAAVLARRIADPNSGYIVRLAECRGDRDTARASLAVQSRAVDDMRRQGEAATAAAAALVQDAQTLARAAERRAQSILQAQAHVGEGQCEAAFRLHQENIQ